MCLKRIKAETALRRLLWHYGCDFVAGGYTWTDGMVEDEKTSIPQFLTQGNAVSSP